MHAAQFSKTLRPVGAGIPRSGHLSRADCATQRNGNYTGTKKECREALGPMPDSAQERENSAGGTKSPKATLAHLQHPAVERICVQVQHVAGQGLAIELYATLDQNPADLAA